MKGTTVGCGGNSRTKKNSEEPMQEKLLKLCNLYENVSKTSGRKYFVGNLSFTAKLLILQNTDAKEGEPQWTAYITEREQQSQPQPKPRPYQETGDHAGGDWPRRR
jgi:hypothetical protein